MKSIKIEKEVKQKRCEEENGKKSEIEKVSERKESMQEKRDLTIEKTVLRLR